MTTHDALNLWDQKAVFWDQLHGDDGNTFHRRLISPSVERLLALQPGEAVADIACGNGVLARRLAALGAHVTATDFSATFLTLARQRSHTPEAQAIDYRQLDATDADALCTLGEGRFDAITSTMAIMDIVDIRPLFHAARRLLKPSPHARFVFATAHPFTNSPDVYQNLEQSGNAENPRQFSLKVLSYLSEKTFKSIGAENEPNSHLFFHRPLQSILNTAFDAGFVMDGIEEPAFTPDDADGERLTWRNLPEIPPVLTVRLRVARPTQTD